MSTIFLLFIETVLLSTNIDFSRAEYSPYYIDDTLLRLDRDYYDDFSFETNVEEHPKVEDDKNHQRVEDIIKEIDDGEPRNSANNPEGDKRSSPTQLAVRIRLAIKLKAVLEEMLVLVEKDIEDSNRALMESSKNAIEESSTSEESYDDLSIRDNDFLRNRQDGRRDGIQDERRIKMRNYVPLDRGNEETIKSEARKGGNYKIMAKVSKEIPKGILLSYDRDLPQ